MKKTLSLILALLMSVSCASFAFANDAAIADTALEEEAAIAETAVVEEEASQYDEAIAFLCEYGIYKGYGEGKLGANDDIQRYQMALFTSRIVTGWVDDAAWNTGIWNASYTEFTDVDEAPASNYLGALSYANQNGIIEGYGDGRFGPTDGINYQNALTMVVRALGYQNLSWPWGFIEKAINLGLTAGITDVAYTDVLTRGEVAQVIYNALFATTKDGTTLAAKNFGIEFGWETVIITASDRAFYSENGKPSEAGIVAYKVVGTDGTLSADTYYTKASTFGLTGHEDELAVGKAFRVCFAKDGMLAAKSLWTETIWNLGEKNADGKYPIQAYLKGYTAVSKYTETTYIKSNGAIAYDHEIIIKEATYGSTKTWTEVDHTKLAIDWTNGNILEADTVDKDGKVLTYKVAWYYNALLDQYYRIKTTATGTDKLDGEIEIVGIDLLDSDKEVEELLKKLNVEKSEAVKAFKTITDVPVSAYASLELYDLNNNGEAEYGLYTSYRLGYLSTSTANCGHAGDKTFISVSNLASTVADATYSLLNDGKADSISYDCNKVVCGECSKCEAAGNDIWWTDDFAPATDDEGEIENAFVLYNYNKVTGELRVLKTIGSDATTGTYVATGVLRSYNVDKMTVNIDGTNYSFKYDELEGNMFPTKDEVTKNNAARAITSAYLRSLFNQYVTYVVVDDAVVYAARKGATTTNYIIVESYAGLSSDGYIVVNGYTTSDLKLTQFRIGSYNGWQKGDYYYNPAIEGSFTKGALYTITSYDKAEDVYYIYLAGEFEDNGEYVVNQIAMTEFTIAGIDTDGYITTTTDGKKDAERKMTADDKWIILGEKDDTTGYAPMIVYTGKIYDTTWRVAGDRVDLGSSKVYFIVNVDMKNDIVGFDYDVYASSYVVFLRNALNSATYDQYGTEEDPWYLLGASTYDVIVFDLLAGKEITVTAQNVYLKTSYIYQTIDGKIVSDERVNTIQDVVDKAYTDIYMDKGVGSADYLSGKMTVAAAGVYAGNKKDDFSKFISNRLGFVNDHKGYCSEVKIYLLDGVAGTTTPAYDKITTITDVSDAKVFEKLVTKAGTFEHDAYYIYNVSTQKVVIYICNLFTTTDVVESTITAVDKAQVMTDAYIEASADVTTSTTSYNNGEVKSVSATLDAVTLTFVGDKTTDTHKAILDASFVEPLYFGFKSDCLFEDWKVVVDGDAQYGSIDVATYDNHTDEEDEYCNLIKAVKVTLDTPVTVTSEKQTVTITFTSAVPVMKNYKVEVAVQLVGGKVVLELVSVNAYAIV